MLINIELIKQHCRIDHDSEDELLKQYESAAKKYIERQLDRNLYSDNVPEDDSKGLIAESDITQAMLMTIAHWYEHRESVVVGSITSTEIKEGVWRLIQPYRIMGV
ncbi:DNA packaging protein [Mannheimia sp. USDA-ARS-USMARC-1261]|uniref:head-tail connector protein n=1 Tax=Mannheimia sp. USDA-ARS-USMARC-1261 TaxID=1432056 RepID=UPI0003E3933C|nr:head-tail connector protein [Mannheimia sp. USDA-ARS-USMARC-1261]AHG72956.1 DNA packaging protein [Mannheimia sp. USDA-ARS-USMARC-1261]